MEIFGVYARVLGMVINGFWRKMWRKMFDKLHQSWCVVWFSIGVVAGVVFGLVFRINFLVEWWFFMLVGILFVISMIRPLFVTMFLALAAGFLLSFMRVGGVLVEMDVSGETWALNAEVEKYGLDGLILNARDWFAGRISGLIPEPEVKLGLSYLLGMKSGLPKDLSESLRVVGLTHIVVASGAHLSILVEVARKIFGKVSRFAGVFGATGFILFFMAMVGWTPSIMRAGIMAILTIVTWYVGRKIAPVRMILMVMAGTLLIDPTFLTNLGWMLSFASYAGIMLVGPKLAKFFYGDKEPGFIGGTVLTTIAATVMTLPITLFYFGQVSLISVVANLLILPTLPVAMGLTFLTGVVAGVPFVEDVISATTTWLLDFHIGVVGFFGEMEQFLVKIEPYNPWVFLIYVPILILLLVGKVVKLREVKNIFGVIFMSGHSKWATTKRQKAVVDAKRGALFTKIGNQIAIAARAGTDPAMNPSLAMVLEKARLANMPKANIERAIARVADKSAAALIEEVYEAYGPGGVGIVIEVATDNKNRTMPEVRHTLDKNGGRMAEPGSVMFQFTRKGVIELSEKGDDAMMVALDAGAEDVVDEDDGTVIYTASSDLMKVRQALVDAGMTVTSAELQYVPNSYIPIEGENAEKLEKLLGVIDDLDDVTNVYTNAE
ncbi:YebC/PmpR family DNA-binding transcriptional regulator [Candidatus Saccharibacteria bacterium]|nr:YebC/PmpR family DNA-binding transcriptional regulator [Candidatus Saccharibacteria bacterium]